MGGVFQLFGEDVGGINYAWDVSDFYGTIFVEFANVIFAEVQVFGSFVCGSASPIDAGLIVVVNCGT